MRAPFPGGLAARVAPTAARAYEIDGERTWISGTLTISQNTYTFKPDREVTGPSVEGVLDFLFEMLVGEVIIEHWGLEYRVFEDSSPGDELATYTFFANSEVVGEFVRVGDSNNLYFHDSVSEEGLWRVTKQLETEVEP